MGARTKLNGIYICGSVAIAGIIEAVAGSWIAFAIVAVVLIACGINDGTIRPTRRR